MPAVFTTPPIGGFWIEAGTCFSTVVSAPGAILGTNVTAVNPQTKPPDGVYWQCWISAADEITVKVCSTQAGFVPAIPYDIALSNDQAPVFSGTVTQRNMTANCVYAFEYAAGFAAGMNFFKDGVSSGDMICTDNGMDMLYTTAFIVQVLGGPTAFIADGSGNLQCEQGLSFTGRTVANLPASAPPAGCYAVLDALNPVAGSAVVGGGSSQALVWWNGGQWKVFGI